MSRSNYLIRGDQRCSSKSQPGHSIYRLKAQSQDLINCLPDDCICDIFRSLDKPKDLKSCATVCWRWADLVLSLASELFKTEKSSLVLKGHDLDDTLLVSNVIDISSRNSVRGLHITRSSTGTAAAGGGPDGHLTDKGVCFVIKAFHNLTSVCLLGCQMITDEGIHHISTRCPMLRSLKIQDCSSITVQSLEALMKQAESLRYLTLGHCPQIPSSAIVSFLILMPGLIDVRLQSMDDVLTQSAGSSEVATTAVSPPIAASKISHELRTLFLDNCAAGYLQELLAQIIAHIQLPLLKCLVIRGSSGRSMNHHDLIRLLGPDTREPGPRSIPFLLLLGPDGGDLSVPENIRRTQVGKLCF
ncbi:F-box/LRR-repeat protein 7 [Brachypodium distachyon]|uniref:F-box domain-containing protein n=1 Tax=Brachypodium distachyon TaxID=15368 RepID=A0A0Q3H1W5_BRADI|nr:F-box/LRR-repeat protein 7 [Brachypodium distachyon]XP_024319196.1 F-box/LRR-repeat protein 7 [Brachypodium distachyon]KQJ87394.1 hypothetical protein BRADI_4g10715v3 [Brachypodium distachyon]|eukprot:XP_024319195.1 F-box/LRR-repeat protein 7 [Brachypodium distachyon]